MKNKNPLFHLYPENSKAFKLSVIGGGVKLLSLFLLVAAILYTIALLIPGFRVAFAGGVATALLFVVDELDDVVFGAFFLWGAFAVCRYAACVLQARAQLLARSVQTTQTSQMDDKMKTDEFQHACVQEPIVENTHDEI